MLMIQQELHVDQVHVEKRLAQLPLQGCLTQQDMQTKS